MNPGERIRVTCQDDRDFGRVGEVIGSIGKSDHQMDHKDIWEVHLDATDAKDSVVRFFNETRLTVEPGEV